MQYLLQIVTSLVLLFAAFLAKKAKDVYTKYINTQIKQDIAESSMLYVEQVYKDIHGDAKLDKALNSAAEELAVLGIPFSSIEMRKLIEAAVAEFNANFRDYEPVLVTGGGFEDDGK